jgi:quercetin dioxygenase-like cupin family protein
MDKSQDINKLINFQEGSIVSKEIINKSTGTITLFAFDKDQGLSEHTAPYDALAIITEGTAEITISGTVHQVKSGEMILMPGNSPHALKAITPFKMILTMIKS